MAIATLTDYYAALRQTVFLRRNTGSNGQIGVIGAGTTAWASCWSSGGDPGAGSLSVGNTANGLVPDNTTTGAPAIQTFTGTGYITGADYLYVNGSQLGAFMLYDRLFHAGSYAFNANTTLASQPSYAARVPGTDYHGLQLWFESNAAYTGNPSVAVTYTNQDGVAGQTTGTVVMPSGNNSWGSPFAMQLPLASGDSGLQKIESVVATIATAGTFNLVVARPLLWCFIPHSLNTDWTRPKWLDMTHMRVVYPTSCLALMSRSYGTTDLSLTLELAAA